MIVFLFGILDILAGLSLILVKFGLFKTVAIILAIYLILKGLIFITSLISIIDIIAAVLMLIAVLGSFYSFTWIAVIWLLQKGFFSIISGFD